MNSTTNTGKVSDALPPTQPTPGNDQTGAKIGTGTTEQPVAVGTVNEGPTNTHSAIQNSQGDLNEIMSKPSVIFSRSLSSMSSFDVSLPPVCIYAYRETQDHTDKLTSRSSNLFAYLSESCALSTGSHNLSLTSRDTLVTAPAVWCLRDYKEPHNEFSSMRTVEILSEEDAARTLAKHDHILTNLNYNMVSNINYPYYDQRKWKWSPSIINTDPLGILGEIEGRDSYCRAQFIVKLPSKEHGTLPPTTEALFTLYHSVGPDFRFAGFLGAPSTFGEKTSIMPSPEFRQEGFLMGLAGTVASALVDKVFETGKNCRDLVVGTSNNQFNAATIDSTMNLESIGPRRSDTNDSIEGISKDLYVDNIRDIISRRGRVTKFLWDSSQGAAVELVKINVAPGQCSSAEYATPSPLMKVNVLHNTPLSMMTDCFDFWRGGLHFDFQIVANKFVQGALLISWSPLADHDFTFEQAWAMPHTQFSVGSESLNVRFTVDYNSAYDLKQCIDRSGSFDAQSYRPTMNHLLKSEEHTMGTLKVWVVNSLARFDDQSATDCEINVYLSAAEDFEFFVPVQNGHGAPNPPPLSFANPAPTPRLKQEMAIEDANPLTSGGLTIQRDGNTFAIDDQMVEARDLSAGLRNARTVARTVPMHNASTETMLERSFRIFSQKWTSTDAEGVLAKIPLPTMIEDKIKSASMVSAISMHRYLRSDLEFEVKVTTSQLTAGALMVTWLPGPLGAMDYSRAMAGMVGKWHMDGMVDAFSKVINLGEERTARLRVPFMSTLNSHTIPLSKNATAEQAYLYEPSLMEASNSMGNLYLVVFNQLRNGDAAVPANINVEMKFVDAYMGLSNEKTDFVQQADFELLPPSHFLPRENAAIMLDREQTQCPLCNMKTKPDVMRIMNHHRNSHARIKAFIFCDCSQTIGTDAWVEHAFTCQHLRPYKCPSCTNIMYGLAAFRRHNLNSHPEKHGLNPIPTSFAVRERLVQAEDFPKVRRSKQLLTPHMKQQVGWLSLPETLKDVGDKISEATKLNEVVSNLNDTLRDVKKHYEELTPEKLKEKTGLSMPSIPSSITEIKESLSAATSNLAPSLVASLLHDVNHMIDFGCVRCLVRSVIGAITDAIDNMHISIGAILSIELTRALHCTAIPNLEEKTEETQSFTQQNDLLCKSGKTLESFNSLVVSCVTLLRTTVGHLVPGLKLPALNVAQVPSFSKGVEILLNSVSDIITWIIDMFLGEDRAFPRKEMLQFVKDAVDMESNTTATLLSNLRLRTKLVSLNEKAKTYLKQLGPQKNNALNTNVLLHANKIMTLNKMASSGSGVTRVSPVVATFQGASRVGKSVLTQTHLPEMMRKYLGLEEMPIYSLNDSINHMDGYNQQPMVIIDDFLQHKEQEILKIFNAMVSTTDFQVPMASLDDKGMKFTSPLVVLTMNEAKPQVPKMGDPNSLWMRIYQHNYHVEKKEEFTTPSGRLDHNKMHKMATERGSALLPDEYLNFWKCRYINGERVPKNDKLHTEENKITFLEIGKEIAESMIAEMKTRKITAQPASKPVYDVTPLDYEYEDESDFQSFTQEGYVTAPIAQLLMKRLLAMNQEFAGSYGYLQNSFRYGTPWTTEPHEFDKEKVYLWPQFTSLFKELRKEVIDRDFWFNRVKVIEIEELTAQLIKEDSEELKNEVQKIERMLRLLKLANGFISVVPYVLAATGAIFGIKSLAPKIKQVFAPTDSSAAPAKVYSAGEQARRRPNAKVVKRQRAAQMFSKSNASRLPKDYQLLLQSCTDTVTNTQPNQVHFSTRVNNQLSTILGLGVRGHSILMPAHYFRELEEGQTMTLTYMNGPEYSKIDLPYRSSDVVLLADEEDANKERDVALYTPGNRIRTFRNLVNKFATDAEMTSVPGSKAVCVELLHDGAKTEFAYHGLTALRVHSNIEVGHAWRNESFNYSRAFITDSTGMKSLCGAPYISERFETGRIVGLHSFGATEKRGCSIVSREDVQYLLDHVEASVEIDSQSANPMDLVTESSTTPFMNTQFIAKISGAAPPTKTKFRTSVLSNLAELPDTGRRPAPMSAKDEGVEVSQKHMDELVMRKGDHYHPLALDHRKLKHVTDFIRSTFVHGDRAVEPEGPSGLFTTQQVINGTGYGLSKTLEMSTSTGFGFQSPTKRSYFQKDENEQWKIADGQKGFFLVQKLRDQEQVYRRGKIPSDSIWKESLKDELINQQKVRDGRSRVIVVPSLSYQMICKKYTGAFTDALLHPNNHGLKTCSAAGIENHKLFTQLWAEKSKTGLFFGADFSQFDATYHPSLVDEYADFINEWYDKYDPEVCEEDRRARRALIREGMVSANFYRGNLYCTKASMNSGFPNGHTIFMNWYVNMVISFYTWLDKGLPLESFFDCVVPVFMGDDQDQTIIKRKLGEIEVSERYNRLAIRDTAEKMGMKVTSPDKVSELTPFDSKAEFISCTYRTHADFPGLVTAALKKTSIIDLLRWYRCSDDMSPEEQQSNNIKDALRFAASWGRDYYEQVVAMLRSHKQDLEIRGIHFDMPSWRTQIIDILKLDEFRQQSNEEKRPAGKVEFCFLPFPAKEVEQEALDRLKSGEMNIFSSMVNTAFHAGWEEVLKDFLSRTFVGSSDTCEKRRVGGMMFGFFEYLTKVLAYGPAVGLVLGFPAAVAHSFLFPSIDKQEDRMLAHTIFNMAMYSTFATKITTY